MPATSRSAAPSRTPSRSARRAAAARPAAPTRRPSLARRPVASPADAQAQSGVLAASDAPTQRALLGGQVLLQGDPGYDAARGAHNTTYDKRPAAIVQPRQVSEIRHV